jgi:hypothetical protein
MAVDLPYSSYLKLYYLQEWLDGVSKTINTLFPAVDVTTIVNTISNRSSNNIYGAKP